MNKDYGEIENKMLLYKSKETIVKEHIELLKRIDKAIELTKNLLKTEDRGYYQILFKEILKSLGDKENGR